jgi:hypothetical protein
VLLHKLIREDGGCAGRGWGTIHCSAEGRDEEEGSRAHWYLNYIRGARKVQLVYKTDVGVGVQFSKSAAVLNLPECMGSLCACGVSSCGR